MLLVSISVEKLWTRSTVKKNNSFRQAIFGAPKPLPVKLHKRWYCLMNQILMLQHGLNCFFKFKTNNLNGLMLFPSLAAIHPHPLCPPSLSSPSPSASASHSPSISSPDHSPSLSLLPSTPDLRNASHCHMGILVCFTYCCIYSTCHSAWHPAGTS